MFGYCLGGADPAERGRGAARPRQFLQNRGTNLPRGRVISRARSELDGHAPDHAVVERPRAARALDPAVQHAGWESTRQVELGQVTQRPSHRPGPGARVGGVEAKAERAADGVSGEVEMARALIGRARDLVAVVAVVAPRPLGPGAESQAMKHAIGGGEADARLAHVRLAGDHGRLNTRILDGAAVEGEVLEAEHRLPYVEPDGRRASRERGASAVAYPGPLVVVAIAGAQVLPAEPQQRGRKRDAAPARRRGVREGRVAEPFVRQAEPGRARRGRLLVGAGQAEETRAERRRRSGHDAARGADRAGEEQRENEESA